MRTLKTICLMLVACSLFAATNINADSFTVSSTPTQFSSTMGKVQSLTFRVIPGYCGKVFIGTATMNTSTYAGVIKVLWPNCSGGLGDEYTVKDITGANSVDTSMLYVAGQIAGEKILWESIQTGCDANGCPSASLRLIPVPVGPVYNASSTQAAGLLQVYGPYYDHGGALVQINTVPGLSGKTRVGGYLMTAQVQPDPFYHSVSKSLFPLSGSMNSTDKWELYGVGGVNDVPTLAVFNEVPGEFVLVTYWQFTAHA